MKNNKQALQKLTDEQERLGLYDQQDELKACVKEFFERYLNYREESDSGKMFAPIHISCCRVMKMEPLNKLLERMRVLSGAKLEPWQP